jgi:disulfide bond formation protein DsbB
MFLKWFKNDSLYLAFLVVLLSILGSLYFSEVMNFAPCVLCWYQRILMYPLALILLVGIWKKDKNVDSYVLPFSILGFLIALYHNLLYYNIIPESLRPCRVGVSCAAKYLELFGFVTIPLMSLVAFAFITACMVLYKKSHQAEK